MDSMNKIRKLEKKLKKFMHIVFKETEIQCDLTTSKNLVICNAGLVNGLSEEIVFKHFSEYGSLRNIVMLPGKSCCFVSYKDTYSACNAFENFNGKLNIAQDNKPIYLLYTANLPDVEASKLWDEPPPGLIIIEEFITENEELELLKLCDFEEDFNEMKNRQVKHYGYEFKYTINNVDKNHTLDEAIPYQCGFLWDRLYKKSNIHFCPDQLTVNHYSPGQGIPQHVDTHSAFEDPIISLSLQSSIVMEFKKEDQHRCILLPRRSLAVISKECRYNWTHGITPRKLDIIRSNNGLTTLKRGVRISFTFRKVLRRECTCIYKSKCDSYNSLTNLTKIENLAAAKLEKLYVHEIYENIASHFSNTRHKPWPNVSTFIESFENGSVILDIGCGNGKYLGKNKNVFKIGCDQSSGLINVCKDKGFEVFTSSCLNVPIRNDIADGVISIAVIHHLANEDRRLQAIKEMIRILKVGGRALIYVWSKDQIKDQDKSSYIKQDRKNRKSVGPSTEIGDTKQVSVLNDITLPVHTNRTQFKHSDLLVPWKLKTEIESSNTFLRFYHVFEENELQALCQKLKNLQVIKSYYDQGNWCVIVKKT